MDFNNRTELLLFCRVVIKLSKWYLSLSLWVNVKQDRMNKTLVHHPVSTCSSSELQVVLFENSTLFPVFQLDYVSIRAHASAVAASKPINSLALNLLHHQHNTQHISALHWKISCDEVLRSSPRKATALISGGPRVSIPFCHLVQFRRFMAPRKLQNAEPHVLQTSAIRRVNNEACRRSSAHWGCNLRAALMLVS